MLEAGERATVEQVRLDVPEWAFDLTLRLRPPRSAGHRPEGVVSRKGQEARVVNRLLSIIPADDDLHVVVETFCSKPAQMGEGGDVFANRRGEVLTLDKIHLLAA